MNGFGYNIYQDNKLVFSKFLFREMHNYNITFKQLEEYLESYKKLRKSFFTGSFDNSEIYIMYNNKIFAFKILNKEFYLWYKGDTSLGNIKIDINEIPSEDFCEWIELLIDNYIKGIIQCSDCGKPITSSEIAGRFFAGQYCEECWKNKWKEIESKENYN